MRLRHAFLSLFGGNALVTVANLVRDITLAAAFGAALDSDVLFLAISIPVFILTVAANAFRSVVVPALSRVQALGEPQFRAVSGRFVQIAVVGTGLVVVCLLGLAAVVYYVELPWASSDHRKMFAVFFAAILPMYAGTAFVEFLQGPLQVVGKFLAPSLLKLGLPIGIIIGVLAFPNMSIFSVSVGGCVGVLIAILGGVYLSSQKQILPALRTSPLPVDEGRIAVSGFKALVAASLITYANPLVDQWMAGLGGAGATSMLGYANRLMTGVAALGAGAISQVLLIHFSRQAGDGDHAGITATYRLLIFTMPWVGCIATLGVWLTSDFLVSALYQRGNFDAADVRVVADLVNRYALQFPLYWTGIAPVTLAWALSMNKIFVRIGVILFLVNIIGDWVFLELFGVRGIPLSTTVVLLVSITLLNLSLRNERRLVIPVSDWLYAALPLSILALCGLLMQRFDVGLSATLDIKSAGPAFLMLAAFGCAASLALLTAFRKYQAIAATDVGSAGAQKAKV
jgi:putative peptidoglycan lipid II flippase